MILVIFISVCYSGLIFWLLLGIKKVQTFMPKSSEEKTYFSIVIPFRNEAASLPDLLNSIQNIDYPNTLFELFLIDDDSTDQSVQIITNFKNNTQDLKITILKNKRISKSPKKDAITTAIKKVKKKWIVTTDADCLLPTMWLKLFDKCIQKNQSEFIIAPVTYSNENSFLNAFQLLDIHSLQGVTLGAFGHKKPFLCNGANLAYTKDLFKKIDGFAGNDTIASGDDVFLLEKAVKYSPEKIFYLKNNKSTVITKAQSNWYKLIQQRIRWAAKTTAYKKSSSKLIALIVFLMNMSIVVCTISSLFFNRFYILLLIVFLSKVFVDFLLLYKIAQFFNQKRHLNFYLLSSVVYPFFTTYVAVKSIFYNYEWKDRKFNR